MLDLQNLDLKREIEELKRNDPGKVRGASLKFLTDYVRQKEGENGLKKVKAELKRYGYELPDIDKVNDMEWIPSCPPTIFMLASAKLFNWQEKDILETGKKIVLSSFPVRLFVKYFLSVEKTFEKAAQSWRKHYTFGQVKLEYKPKEKRVLVRLENYKRHPLFCIHFLGVFSKIIEMTTGTKNVQGKETKCEFRGDPYHEFVFNWQ